jgi:hypothetical protein
MKIIDNKLIIINLINHFFKDLKWCFYVDQHFSSQDKIYIYSDEKRKA